MRSTRRSSGRFQEEAASKEQEDEEEQNEEAELGRRERRSSRCHGERQEQEQEQEQAERRSSRRAALKRSAAEMEPPPQQRALRRRRSSDPDSEAPQGEAGDAEECSSGRVTRRSARVKAEPDDDGIQNEEDGGDDQPPRRPRNLRQRPKVRDLAAENLDLEESSEEESSEEESSEEESSEEDSDEDEEEEEGNRRRSARARTETQRYEPRLGGGEDEQAAPWRGHGRLERRNPASRGSAGGARGASSRRAPARRGGSAAYRSKRSRRSAAGRADSDEDDVLLPRRRSNSSRRDRRRRGGGGGGGGGARSDDSLNSEEEVERRRIRSLARQRANVRPINASYLPSSQLDANGLNAFGTGDAGAGGSAAKLGQIDVEPIEVDLKVNFDEIGGLGPVIHSLKEMISLPLLYPELYERFSITPPRGVLFYGPPGTGKTLVAKALAASCSQGEQRVAFFMRNGADCLSKWVGEAERQLRVTFEQAYLHQPSIIFFDEIDGLAPVRSSKQDQIHSSVVSTLLGLMDGLQSRGKVVVIGATNRIDSIDPALRRPGRFDREFLFPMPTEKARRAILQIHTDKWSPKPAPELLDDLASKCTGYCGADIKALCAEAALSAVNRSYPQIYHCDQKLLIDEKTVQVQRRDFDEARRKVVPSLHRSSQNYAKPLGDTLEPLLGPVASAVVRELRSGFFPFCEPVAAFRSAGDTDNSIANQLTIGDQSGAEAASSLHTRPPPSWSTVHIHGPAECGQHEVAAAVLQLLGQSGQSVPVHGLDLVSLSSTVSTRTLEEAAVGVVHQAAVVTPSILFLPHLQVIMRTGYEQLRTIIMGAIERLPLSVLLLVTSDVPISQLPPGAPEFLQHHGVGHALNIPLTPPNAAARRLAYERALKHLNEVVPVPQVQQLETGSIEDLVLAPVTRNPAQEAAKAAREAMTGGNYVRAVGCLRRAMSLNRNDGALKDMLKTAEAQVQHQREEARKLLLNLRLDLREIIDSVEKNRKFKMFMHPVSPEDAPDYYEKIENPMDVENIRAKNDSREYEDIDSFMHDVNLILQNAKAYNSAASEQGAEIIARAHAFVDFVERRVDDSDAREFSKLYAALRERGAGAAVRGYGGTQASASSAGAGSTGSSRQYGSSRGGGGQASRRSRTDVVDWDISGPSQPTEYKPPSGARASRRVAGAAPEVELRFGEMQRPVEYAAGNKQRAAGTSTAPSPDKTGGATADTEQTTEKGALADGSDSTAAANADTTTEGEHSERRMSGDGEEDADKKGIQEELSESDKKEPDTAETAKMDNEEASGHDDESTINVASVDASASIHTSTATDFLAPHLASAASAEDTAEETFVSEDALNQLLDRFVTHTDGCNCKQLQHVHARLACVAWLHRHAHDKRSALQELELVADALGRSVASNRA